MSPTQPETTQQQFDQAYWASQPPEAQALQTIDPSERAAQAATLATSGFIVDVPIMVWAWDAYLVMTMRAQYGYTWVPSALQPPITVAPTLQWNGQAYNPAAPPPGSIIVPPMAELTAPGANVAALLQVWYPPYAPPTPSPATPPTPAPSDPVGVQTIGNIYTPVPGDDYPNGATYTDSRGTFQKVVIVTPFGRVSYWELIP